CRGTKLPTLVLRRRPLSAPRALKVVQECPPFLGGARRRVGRGRLRLRRAPDDLELARGGDLSDPRRLVGMLRRGINAHVTAWAVSALRPDRVAHRRWFVGACIAHGSRPE